MVKINRVYTKTGDQGETGLVGGRRVSKDSPRVCAYGELDELNSFLGLVRTASDELGDTEISEMIAIIQNEIFDIGSVLATSPEDSWEGMPKITNEQIERIEGYIDSITTKIPELKSFVLPGGTFLNAYLHIARAVCRRVERQVVALSKKEPVSNEIIVYLNRLNDLLFTLARYDVIKKGKPEYLWQIGSSLNRKK